MSPQELEIRLGKLEKAVAELQQRLPLSGNGSMDPKTQPHWWIAQAGKYKDDPDFDEVVRLGRKYRDSQNPYLKKKKRPPKRKSSK